MRPTRERAGDRLMGGSPEGLMAIDFFDIFLMTSSPGGAIVASGGPPEIVSR